MFHNIFATVPERPVHNLYFILDRGSLIYRVVWPKQETFATDDADVHIEKTAIETYEKTKKQVVVIGQDVDLLVLPTALTPDYMDILMLKEGKGVDAQPWVIFDVIGSRTFDFRVRRIRFSQYITDDRGNLQKMSFIALQKFINVTYFYRTLSGRGASRPEGSRFETRILQICLVFEPIVGDESGMED
ncbi:hypothetical protein AVEN_23578-1 [Araneus ventricosus]|uniref:Uncharacterized protein n=1 Tax=Araneus ventricosus TaxID=182803 RepID=A0A4Y2LB20_ARAVE|nr:hypothetical protein AVEN_23578-1 [Araneus ventricosus]